jgi:heat-inducible transcriptional repressor
MKLDSRKSRILQAIVHDYVSTAEPVGSQRLVACYDMGCKPATVRNEMAEMADLGYLVQPHTSAGRIPSDRGYRYYVDVLMDVPNALSRRDAARARAESQAPQSDVTGLLLQTCRILSALTSYPSVATDPDVTVTTVVRLFLTRASMRHALLVVLLSTGHVEHQLVEIETAPSDADLARIANYLNSLFAGKELQHAVRTDSVQELPGEIARLGATTARILSAFNRTARALAERRIYLEGTNRIFQHPEFQDVRRLENLLAVLQQQGAMYQVLCRAMLGNDVTIAIGTENELARMQECSVVSRQYTIECRPAGYVAVVGPTRMDYARVAAAVNLMADSLSQTLTNLSLA